MTIIIVVGLFMPETEPPGRNIWVGAFTHRDRLINGSRRSGKGEIIANLVNESESEREINQKLWYNLFIESTIVCVSFSVLLGFWKETISLSPCVLCSMMATTTTQLLVASPKIVYIRSSHTHTHINTHI